MDDLARPPGDRNLGNYNAQVKLVLGSELGTADTILVECPMLDSKGGGRAKVPVPLLPASEWFCEQFLDDDEHALDDDSVLATPLDIDIPDDGAWTPAQEAHEVVQEAIGRGVHRSRIRRAGLHLDDAGFTKQESFCGLFINDLETGKRGLLSVCRKADLCKCGCMVFVHFIRCMRHYGPISRW